MNIEPRKVCTKCDLEKLLSEFHKDKTHKDGHRSSCKLCGKLVIDAYYINNVEKIKKTRTITRKLNKEKISKKSNDYYHENKKNINAKRKEDYIKNKTYILNKKKTYYNKNKEKTILMVKKYANNNKDKIAKKNKQYRENNKEKLKIKTKNYIKHRRATDNLFKLKDRVSNLITKSLKIKNFNKTSRTTEILGCSYIEFKTYLENKFEPWMNWTNYGNWNGIPTEPNFAWDIDHIIPLSSAITEEDIIRLNHYSNLQPLCSYINRVIKKDKHHFYG